MVWIRNFSGSQSSPVRRCFLRLQKILLRRCRLRLRELNWTTGETNDWRSAPTPTPSACPIRDDGRGGITWRRERERGLCYTLHTSYVTKFATWRVDILSNSLRLYSANFGDVRWFNFLFIGRKSRRGPRARDRDRTRCRRATEQVVEPALVSLKPGAGANGETGLFFCQVFLKWQIFAGNSRIEAAGFTQPSGRTMSLRSR